MRVLAVVCILPLDNPRNKHDATAMRFRLLRRLTVSAPRMAVRSALPWPFRWACWPGRSGFCAAIALWAFEFGKDIAGLDHG
jgi:hypothetical protein